MPDKDSQKSCNHDKKHQKIVVMPKSIGGMIGGTGGSFESSEIVLVCKKCEAIYGLKDTRKSDKGVSL